ncbi:Importin [Entamoeba marina]
MSLAQQILSTCELSLQNDNRKLVQANELFNQLYTAPEFGITSFQLLNEPEVNIVLKQQSSDDTLHIYKEMLLKTIISSTSLVQKQLANIIQFIINIEFPIKCNDLLTMIISLFNTQDVIMNETAFIGLILSFNTVIKSFRYKTDDYPVMIDFFSKVFDKYVQIVGLAVTNQKYSYTKYLFKSFKYVIYTKVPTFFTNENLTQLYQFIFQFLQQPFVFGNNEKDPQCSSLIGILRGSTSFISHNSNQQKKQGNLQQYFIANIAPPLVGHLLNTIQPHFPTKLLFYISNVFSVSIKVSVLSKLIADNFKKLFEQVFFPSIMFSQSEYDLILDDPIEFLRQSEEDDFGGVDARTGALLFITTAMKFRAKKYLPLLINPLSPLIPTSEQQMNNLNSQQERLIDTSVYIVSKIARYFVINEHYASYIPQLFSTTVPLLLTTTSPLLVRRGCLLMGILFGILNFKPTSQLPEYVLKTLQILFPKLTSNAVIERVSASGVIGRFVNYDCLINTFRPILASLYASLLQTARIVENEDVVDSLSVLLQRFPEETKPFALDVARGLLDVCQTIEATFSDLDEDGQLSAGFTAASALNSVADIIRNNIKNSQDAPQSLCEVIAPSIKRWLVTQTPFSHEIFESTIGVVLAFISVAPLPFIPPINEIFTEALKSTTHMSLDAIQSIEPVITTYIARDSLFLSNEENRKFLMQLINNVCTAGDFDLEALSVMRIAQSVLLVGQGMVDDFVPFLVKTLLPSLDISELITTLQALETILFCFLYDPLLTLHAINDCNAIPQFFIFWTKLIPKQLPTVMDKKISIIALVSLLTLPLNKLPECIAGDLTQHYAKILLLIDLANQQRERIQLNRVESAKNVTLDVTQPIADLNDGEDFVYGSGIPDIDNYDFDDELLIDDEDDEEFLSLDEKKLFVDTLKRVMQGDLMDERHALSLRNLPEELRQNLTNSNYFWERGLFGGYSGFGFFFIAFSILGVSSICLFQLLYRVFDKFPLNDIVNRTLAFYMSISIVAMVHSIYSLFDVNPDTIIIERSLIFIIYYTLIMSWITCALYDYFKTLFLLFIPFFAPYTIASLFRIILYNDYFLWSVLLYIIFTLFALSDIQHNKKEKHVFIPFIMRDVLCLASITSYIIFGNLLVSALFACAALLGNGIGIETILKYHYKQPPIIISKTFNDYEEELSSSFDC